MKPTKELCEPIAIHHTIRFFLIHQPSTTNDPPLLDGAANSVERFHRMNHGRSN